MLELKTYQKRILDFLGKKREEVTVEDIAKGVKLKKETVNSVCEALRAKELVKVRVMEYKLVELTEEGQRYKQEGLPERRLLSLLSEKCSMSFKEIREEGLSKKELRIGIGWLRRKDLIEVENSLVKLKKSTEELPASFLEGQAIKQIPPQHRIPLSNVDVPQRDQVISRLKRRNLVKIVEKKTKKISLLEKGRKVVENEIKVVKQVSQLSPEMIKTGGWKDAQFSEYDVSLSSYDIFPGKKHPYRQIIDQLRDLLVGMGFQERKGPYVELNFWNCDTLFMPSDHPARDVHDMFHLKKPAHGDVLDKELWENVKQTHIDGWKTESTGWGFWDEELAKKLVLRSQTTPVSTRSLAELSEKNLPVKIFTIDRNFRPDVIDPSHFIEFYQCEGIVVDQDLNFRNLLWYLQKIASELGFESDEVRFKPGYFPFTEPSVEGFVKIPDMGWIEALPGGIFRPEVTKPLGIDVPVLAWGIGIDRLAMKKLEIYDLRKVVFNTNLDMLRKKPNVLL